MSKKRLACLLSKKKIFFLLIFLISSSLSFAQQKITISGKVISETNAPLAGVSVKAKNATAGTTTDEQGKFSVQVNKGAVIIFSYVGYDEQRLTAKNENNSVSIQLVSKSGSLNDVIVVGYGSQTKRDLASSSSKVTARQFQTAVITTVDQALQGRATGIQITASSGEPGASTIIRIRGNNSLIGSNEPLYVIDGFPMPEYKEAPSTVYGVFAQNGLYGINPNDIESIDVLKDASATAIYGSRGANGVVLITTKSGKRGEGKIEFVNKTSFGSAKNPLIMMNNKQFAEIYNEYSLNGGNPKPFGNIDTLKTNTNWFDAVTRPTLREDISMNISGGAAKTAYYISGNYLRDQGLLIGSDLKRASVRASINSEVNNWYTINAQVSLVRQNSTRGVSSNGGWPDGGGLLETFRASPLYHLDDVGPKVPNPIPGGGEGFFSNPLIRQTDKSDLSKNDYTVLNIGNLFQLIPGLKLSVNIGSVQNLTRRLAFFPKTVAEGFYANGVGDYSNSNTYSYNANAYLQYDKLIHNYHKVNLTLGTEYTKDDLETLFARNSGFNLVPLGINNLAATDAQQTLSYKQSRIIQSAFFRSNYSFKGKYILNASIRLDGASPFSENKKYGFFPAAGVAWNLNEESFMKNLHFVTNSKIRTSYGITGSQAITPYSSLPTYGNDFYQVGNSPQTVVYPFTLGNPNLSWEKTKQFNAGLDFSTFNNRITFSFDYYDKTTLGLLQPRLLPSQSGYASITDNYGSISNKGVELSIQAELIRSSNFHFTSRFNISKNKNILLDLGSRKTAQFQSLSGNLQGGVYGILTPGEEIGKFYGFGITGLAQSSDFTNGVPNYPFPVTGQVADQRPGSWKYLDINKDGVISSDDRKVLGKSSPDFTYGWNNDITYKRLGINLFFIGVQGNQILNMTHYYLNNGIIGNSGITFNQTQDWYQHRYTPANPTNNINYPATQTNAASADINSTMIENGSYFRLKQATISYAFPSSKTIKNLKIFVTGTNVFTITKYKGFDPEVSNFGTGLLQQGIDYGAYPSQRSYTIGISGNF